MAKGRAPGNGIGQSPADFWGLPKRQRVGNQRFEETEAKAQLSCDWGPVIHLVHTEFLDQWQHDLISGPTGQ